MHLAHTDVLLSYLNKSLNAMKSGQEGDWLAGPFRAAVFLLQTGYAAPAGVSQGKLVSLA